MSKNGQLRDDELEVVQAPVRLARVTARAWRALVADVRAETGITITITTPRGGYRDLAMQKAAAGTGNHQYKPGTSVHGHGTCVDIWNWAAVGTKRLDTVAARHGFRRTIESEPWHYQHDGKTAPPPPAQPRRRHTMMLFHTPTTGPTAKTYPVTYWLVAENGARAQFVGGSEFANQVAAQLGNSISTDMAFLDTICQRLATSQPPTGKVTLDAAAVVDELLKRIRE